MYVGFPLSTRQCMNAIPCLISNLHYRTIITLNIATTPKFNIVYSRLFPSFLRLFWHGHYYSAFYRCHRTHIRPFVPPLLRLVCGAEPSTRFLHKKQEIYCWLLLSDYRPIRTELMCDRWRRPGVVQERPCHSIYKKSPPRLTGRLFLAIFLVKKQKWVVGEQRRQNEEDRI